MTAAARNDIDTTTAEYQRLLHRQPNQNWALDLEQQLRMTQPYALYSADLDQLVNDYLDHHGELTRDIDDVDHEENDYVESANRARRTLHNHMLAINLLLRRIDVHEWHKEVRMWHESRAAQPPA